MLKCHDHWLPDFTIYWQERQLSYVTNTTRTNFSSNNLHEKRINMASVRPVASEKNMFESIDEPHNLCSFKQRSKQTTTFTLSDIKLVKHNTPNIIILSVVYFTLLTSGLINPYHLDESLFSFTEFWLIFPFLSYYA